MPVVKLINLRVRALFVALFIIAATIQAASAQQIRIIQDAEIETMLHAIVTPLLSAAGLPNADPEIYIVADRRFNAFVVENGDIFINYGTILDVQTPNALRAVLAHEIAHLAGGHLARIRQQADLTARLQVVAMVLGASAAIAGTAGGVEDVGAMAGAFILASQSVGVNSLMAFRRSEETAADITALRLLSETGHSTKGMVDILTLLKQSNAVVANATPYLRSHPLAQERLDTISISARASATWSRADSAAETRQLAMAQAKIAGYLESRQTTMDRYPNSDRSLPARYARTITAYNSGAAISAVQQMPTLISLDANNPFLYELHGQMLLEIGQPQQALQPIQRALSMAPDQYLIRLLYGHALVETGSAANMSEAITQLSRVTLEAPNSVRGFILLGRAHAALGNQGQATLAAAEAALARGQTGTALGLARQAQQNLIENSPAWLRADDILSIEG